jgi:tRNA U34 5-carboxymethylaminomethyl modifying enzyme MnmG/GidA
MLFKKSPSPNPQQSQSISGSQITNAQVQQAQAGGDAIASQAGNLAIQQQGMSGVDVVRLLTELEAAVRTAGIEAADQQKILNSVGAAKDEAQREDADKDMVAKNLKRANETLEGLDKATTAGKSLWEKGQAVFGAIAPWLGAGAKLLGL